MTVDTTIQLTGRLEPRSAWEATDCSLARALDVVSTRSAFLLLREAFYGATRFDEFASRVGISEPVAAARLRELVDHGLLERVPYQEAGQRKRLGYHLTEQGAELLPALVALMQWGDRWCHDDDGPIELRHAGCGAPVGAELRCAAGHHVETSELEAAAARRAATQPTAHSRPTGS